MAHRIANSLDQMRAQINKHAPNRNRASDGWIGDAKHALTTSDHNPWVRDGKQGIVTALDITHDPARGVDTWKLADHLRTKRDPRIKYVISNGRIFSSIVAPWTWRKYTGSNPHRSHIHVSVHSTKAHYDDARDWDLGLASTSSPTPPVDDGPENRPVLRKGPPFENREHVKTVQRLLMVELVDGLFGPATEREVRAFQKNRNILVDGVVGRQTWAELDKIEGLPRPYNFDDAAELVGEPIEDAPQLDLGLAGATGAPVEPPPTPRATGATGPTTPIADRDPFAADVERERRRDSEEAERQRREREIPPDADDFDNGKPERDRYEEGGGEPEDE